MRVRFPSTPREDREGGHRELGSHLSHLSEPHPQFTRDLSLIRGPGAQTRSPLAALLMEVAFSVRATHRREWLSMQTP